MTWPAFTASPADTVIPWAPLSTWAYHESRLALWAMITIHAFGYGSYGLGPAKSTTPSPAASIGVYIGAAMSMPWWKCAQSPTGGSEGKPVHPNSWVITPLSGQIRAVSYTHLRAHETDSYLVCR